jgi:class 3 adenylate cyclase
VTLLDDEIGASIDRTLLEAARRNEMRVAWVRVVALVGTAALNVVAHLHPQEAFGVDRYSLANGLAAATWAAAALMLALLLHHGWYRAWLRLAMPAADGVLILFLFLLLFGTSDPSGPETSVALRGTLVNMAAVCTLLALSGSLRLSRLASVVTTVLAMVAFVSAASFGDLRAVEIAFVCTTLLAAGVLGAALADVARHAVRSEVARIVLSRFLPDRVMAGAHDAPLEMLTKPRSLDATVLISDLRGFTTYAEGRSPEEVLAFLNRVQGSFAAIVCAHGGTVDKFLGDGMLAVFGAPDEAPDHAAHAIRAARDMLAAASDFDGVRVGIGVHSGAVVSGCLGSGLRLEFTVVGDAVNTASRLESMTKELGVTALVSEASATRAGAHTELAAHLRSIGEVAIRGRQGMLRLFVLE